MQSFIVVGVIIGFGTKRDFILFSKASFLARKIKLVIWQVFIKSPILAEYYRAALKKLGSA